MNDDSHRTDAGLLRPLLDHVERQKNANESGGKIKILRNFDAAAVHKDTFSHTVDTGPRRTWGRKAWGKDVW